MDKPIPNEDFNEIIKSIPAEQFDGHTDFDKLTHKQRLDWLAAAVQFWFKYGKPKGNKR